jgi:hypothetical protein
MEALATADCGDLAPLVGMFVRIEKECFLKALSLSEDVIRERATLRNVLDAAVSKLRERREEVINERKRVFETAKTLAEEAYEKLHQLEPMITAQLSAVSRNYHAITDKSDSNTDGWFKVQIVETAKRLKYFADTRTYKAWARLRIFEERQTSLVLSFHALGTEFVGICGVSAFVEYRDFGEDRHATPQGPYLVCDEVFEFSYLDPVATLSPRFLDWLERVLTLAMDQWRRQI